MRRIIRLSGSSCEEGGSPTVWVNLDSVASIHFFPDTRRDTAVVKIRLTSHAEVSIIGEEAIDFAAWLQVACPHYSKLQ